jgi:hypothetical protein
VAFTNPCQIAVIVQKRQAIGRRMLEFSWSGGSPSELNAIKKVGSDNHANSNAL